MSVMGTPDSGLSGLRHDFLLFAHNGLGLIGLDIRFVEYVRIIVINPVVPVFLLKGLGICGATV